MSSDEWHTSSVRWNLHYGFPLGELLHCLFSLIKTQEEISEVRHIFKHLRKIPEFPSQWGNEIIYHILE